MKTFKFPSLAQKNVTAKQGDVSLTLEDTEVDEQVWKVNVTLVYPGEGPAFESYRQGFSTTGSGSSAPTARDSSTTAGSPTPAPTAASSASSTSSSTPPASRPTTSSSTKRPSKVITIPLEFEFKDIPLP